MNPLTRLAAMLSGGRVSLLALAAAALLGGCDGDEGTIPPANSDQLLARLTEIEEAIPRGDCDGAQDSADLFVNQVDQLPAEVDDEVKRLLLAGGERLQELAADQCEEATPTGPSGEAGFEPPPEEETTTTSSSTTTTSTTEEEQQAPPDDDGGDGNGNQGAGNTGNQGGGNSGGGGNQSGGTGSGGIGGGGD